MALPPEFESPSEYFEECVRFFKNYQHLFKYPNTDILITNILEQIDAGDLGNTDVFASDFDIRTLESEYMRVFFENLVKFKVDYGFISEDEKNLAIDVPISMKKKHEISNLGKEIKNLCHVVKCDTIVDFGSGLGYLDQQLFETTTLNVLGLECNDRHYVGAKKRQRKYHTNSVERVKYIKHMVQSESFINIQEYLHDKFPDHKSFCITGLHACADLTIDAINIFLKMDRAHALIIMPCCYHRLEKLVENNTFKNFPLSNSLREVYKKHDGFEFFDIPFLRLAAQSQNNIDDNLNDLVFNLLARGVLQVYAKKRNCTLKRNKRKAVRLKSIENKFEAYILDASDGFKLIYKDTSNRKPTNVNQEVSGSQQDFDLEELLAIWRDIPEIIYKKAAIFVLLQNYLQPIFENFVLYDRLVYLQERGIENCTVKKIVNEKLSPRCLALLAQK